MTGPHTFTAIKPGSNRCQLCGGWSDHPDHSYELWTDADKEREAARQDQETAEMTARLRRPLKDVSCATGIMERESPLFLGSGINPTLF